MPRYIDVFLSPVRDSLGAQVVTVALLALTALDVLAGCAAALWVRHDFSSHELRSGLVRKMGNLGMLAAADVVDAMLLGGLELGFQPVYMAIGTALALMELWSFVETYAATHPEFAETEAYKMLLRSKRGDDGKEAGQDGEAHLC